MKTSYNTLYRNNESSLGLEHHSYKDVMDFLRPVSEYYPDIESWFNSKVIPGVQFGTRRIEKIYVENKIVAIGIAKDSCEKKICTIRVLPEYENRGFGTQIIDSLIDWLATDKPLITVAEEKISDFKSIFKKNNFLLSYTHNGLYRKDKVEYVFNYPNSF